MNVEVKVEPLEITSNPSEQEQADGELGQRIYEAEEVQKLLSSEWNLKEEQIRILVNEDDFKA
ncbi:hypothetical protein D3C76_1055410 [compost metagenome]